MLADGGGPAALIPNPAISTLAFVYQHFFFGVFLLCWSLAASMSRMLFDRCVRVWYGRMLCFVLCSALARSVSTMVTPSTPRPTPSTKLLRPISRRRSRSKFRTRWSSWRQLRWPRDTRALCRSQCDPNEAWWRKFWPTARISWPCRTQYVGCRCRHRDRCGVLRDYKRKYDRAFTVLLLSVMVVSIRKSK